MTSIYTSSLARRIWAVLALVVLISSTTKAHAAGCTNASLSGAYVAVGTGIRIAFNGKGKLTGIVQDVSRGAFQTYAGTGTYTVNPTCLVSFTFQSAVGSSVAGKVWLYDLDTQGKSSLAYGASGKALIDRHSKGSPFVLQREIGRK